MAVKQQKTVRTLIEALPYIRRFAGTTMVMKYGGEMASAQLRAEFAADIVLLKLIGLNPVVVHGGGPEVSRQMEKLGLEVDFIDGLRVTDAEAMEVVRMVLAGKVNKEIVGLIRAQGGTAVGLSGEDASLIIAEPESASDDHGDPIELGHVGRVAHIDTTVLEVLASAHMIPVVASIGAGADGQIYNINADTVAGELAVALQAEKIVFVSDLGGIVGSVDLQDEEAHAVMTVISECTLAELDALQSAGGISGGMIPKANAVRRALKGGVRSAHIIDGRVEHALLLEVLTDAGCGTKVSG
jgi:acetylglutamate kinase